MSENIAAIISIKPVAASVAPKPSASAANGLMPSLFTFSLIRIYNVVRFTAFTLNYTTAGLLLE